jgi:catechol 2,3-dioxygenase-like lactoylglutathione lyase family enzyme
MDPEAFHRFTDRLIEWAEADGRVLGLVGAGSTADLNRAPDEWSDHDLWVVAVDGAAPDLRADVSWLPDDDRILLHFMETAHGFKALYEDGHLVEAAVFEPGELSVAVSNDVRVLVDKGGVADAVAATRVPFGEAATMDDTALVGQFLTNLLVGVRRWARGEHESGRTFIAHHAVGHLLRLAARHAGPRPDVLDTLDPARRIENALPAFASDLERSLAAPAPEAARRLIDLATATAPEAVRRHGAVAEIVLGEAREVARGVARLHHAQLAMPPGEEARARQFYADVLGMVEVPKPPVLADRGGCWFRSSWLELHLGVDAAFAPAAKAHPALVVGDLDDVAVGLEEAGHTVQWDPLFPGHRRFYTHDPFGNRIEFLEPEP